MISICSKKTITAWVILIIWAVFIFYLSAQPAERSNNLSKGLVRVIIKAVDIVYPLDVKTSTTEDWVKRLNSIVREYAHATVFLILGTLSINAFKSSGFKSFKAFMAAFALCAFFALLDEFHQLFVSGRAWELGDLGMDCIGTLIGLSFYGLGIFTVFSFRRIAAKRFK